MAEPARVEVIKCYASLIGPLLGIYYPIPICSLQHIDVVGILLSSTKLRSLWCSVYPTHEARRCVDNYGGLLLPDEFAMRLLIETEDTVALLGMQQRGAVYTQEDLICLLRKGSWVRRG